MLTLSQGFIEAKIGMCQFHFKRTKLDKHEHQWGFLISSWFCTGIVNVTISGVLILLYITIRLRMKCSKVLLSFQSEEFVKITSSKSTIISPFHSSFSSLTKTTLVWHHYFALIWLIRGRKTNEINKITSGNNTIISPLISVCQLLKFVSSANFMVGLVTYKKNIHQWKYIS